MRPFILALCMLMSGLSIGIYAYNKNKEPATKDNILTIIIEKPLSEVFEFTTNPRNTPLWLESVAIEKTNEWPPRVGTIYQNQDYNGQSWSTYKVCKYTLNKEFELFEPESSYHVNYNYSECPDGSTKLIYHEWVTKGTLDCPFTQYDLNKLKFVLENQYNLPNKK